VLVMTAPPDLAGPEDVLLAFPRDQAVDVLAGEG
jgi:hypothetical protein